MKEKKINYVLVRLSDTQKTALQNIIDSGKAKSTSSAIQYLINSYMIKGE
jgi:hypothetical protein